DGIRDGHVTGVQTCALPILTGPLSRDDRHFLMPPARRTLGAVAESLLARRGSGGRLWRAALTFRAGTWIRGRRARENRSPDSFRSEERRVGEGWRSWWLWYC